MSISWIFTDVNNYFRMLRDCHTLCGFLPYLSTDDIHERINIKMTTPPTPRILFVCKRRPANYGSSYGLLNSCRFLCNALKHLGIEASLVEVIDNNFIEREVVKYKATHVFIEALWVVPEKFNILIPLHPNIQWFVRLHSNTPFIANEGVAIDWIRKYAELQKVYPQFHIAPNSAKMCRDLRLSLGIPTIYAPNVYHPNKYEFIRGPLPDKDPLVLEIGCFGAIRPLKNQLLQAMAAMRYADEEKKKLRFHINHSRLEQNGENVYKNLKALFRDTKHELVEHGWLLHEDFMKIIRSMDLGLQVSFSETFNIVAADFVHLRVPVVVSAEIEWANWLYKADPTDIDSIIFHLWLADLGRKWELQRLNKWGLENYNWEALKVWKLFLNV